MDSAVTKRVTSSFGRRMRPGSMIASRMMVFEAAVQQQQQSNAAGGGRGGWEKREPTSRPLLKARSMVNLVSEAGYLTKPAFTPEPRAVVCNPSTGQAVPRVSSTSSLLTCIRATATGGPAHKPHPPPTPVRGGSTSSTDSDYSTGSLHSPPRDEDPSCLDPPDDPPQASPTTGARRGIGNLKQLFEKSHHTPLSRATSLPRLSPLSQPHPITPSPQPHKVAVLPNMKGCGLKSSTLPTSFCPRKSGPPRERRIKIPLLPLTAKHVRIVQPYPQRNGHHDNAKSAERTHIKVPLLPPSASRTPAIRYSSRSPASDVPPPKPPRAPNRHQLHNIQQLEQVCVLVDA